MLTKDAIIRQTFTQESDGWWVHTYVDAVLTRSKWTSGTKRHANEMAARELEAIHCAGCNDEAPMFTTPAGWWHAPKDGREPFRCAAHEERSRTHV